MVLHGRADHAAGVGDEVRHVDDPALVQGVLGLGGDRDVRPRHHELRGQPVDVVLADHVGPRGRHPDLARHRDQVLAGERPAPGELADVLARALVLDEGIDVEAVRVLDRAPRVRRRHDGAALLRQEARRVDAHRAEALDHHASPVEGDPDVGRGDLRRVPQAEARRAELVEGNPADLAGQAHGAADLVLHPGHAALVGAHVGPEDVVALAAQGVGESAHQLLLALARGGGIAVEHRLPAAVGESGRGVLHAHRTRQAEALVGAHVGRHAQAPDRRTGGDVVDHQGPTQADSGLVYVDDLGRAEIVGERECLLHGLLQGWVRGIELQGVCPARRAPGRGGRHEDVAPGPSRDRTPRIPVGARACAPARWHEPCSLEASGGPP